MPWRATHSKTHADQRIYPENHGKNAVKFGRGGR